MASLQNIGPVYQHGEIGQPGDSANLHNRHQKLIFKRKYLGKSQWKKRGNVGILLKQGQEGPPSPTLFENLLKAPSAFALDFSALVAMRTHLKSFVATGSSSSFSGTGDSHLHGTWAIWRKIGLKPPEKGWSRLPWRRSNKILVRKSPRGVYF